MLVHIANACPKQLRYWPSTLNHIPKTGSDRFTTVLLAAMGAAGGDVHRDL